MQYKIPVQIENEDPIVLGLSLRQLTIIIIWWWIWYTLFTSLAPSIWAEIAAIPALIIAWLAVIIAVFKYSEMTFVPFIFSFLRLKTNISERRWIKWVDGFQPIDVWHLTTSNSKKDEKIDFSNKIDKIKELEDQLHKI
jgi:glucan phosphoethanolaminetransferase (alkaline phosphatase superfamily)